MVYGGTIRPGSCEGYPQLDIISAFQSYGKYLQDGQTSEAEKERARVIRHSCPGAGACGGVSELWFAVTNMDSLESPDVHCEYDGKRSRGFRHDPPWLIFIPG
jgi:Dehydratase family